MQTPHTRTQNTQHTRFDRYEARAEPAEHCHLVALFGRALRVQHVDVETVVGQLLEELLCAQLALHEDEDGWLDLAPVHELRASEEGGGRKGGGRRWEEGEECHGVASHRIARVSRQVIRHGAVVAVTRDDGAWHGSSPFIVIHASGRVTSNARGFGKSDGVPIDDARWPAIDDR